MCENCGCGQPSNTHGQPLNITYSRLKLVADRNNSTPLEQAINMVATLQGVISSTHPRGDDEITVKVTRTKVKPKMEARYVERSKLTRPKTKA